MATLASVIVQDIYANLPTFGIPGRLFFATDTKLNYYDTGSSWVLCGGQGTVTSVAVTAPADISVGGSPITASGTLALTYATQAANTVHAGPGSGSAAAPTYRALVAADIPAIAESGVTSLVTDLSNKAPTSRTISTTAPLTGGGDLSANRTLAISAMTGDAGSGGAAGSVPAPAAGTAAAGKYLKADATWAVPPGTGVTSVAVTVPSDLSVSGSPITTSGTFAISANTQTANLVKAGPASGSAATPTYRALVALDIPAIAESGVTNLTTDLAAKALGATTIATTAPLTGGGDLTANRTFAISNFTGDSGSGGAKGAVPAPASGDSAAGKFLAAGGGWSVPAGSVTSVALTVPSDFSVSGSPITSSGTLAVTANTQSANLVKAGPASGSAAAPTYRSLVALDIPAIAESGVTNLTTDLAAKALGARNINTTAPLTGGGDLTADRTLAISNMTGDAGSGGAAGSVPAPGAGDAAAAKFLKADGTWAVPSGAGSVGSVALAMPADFSVTGSPITSSGTLTAAYATQSANVVHAGPSSGSAAAPTYRALVAADLPSGTNPLTTKGDVYTYSTAQTRLAVGSNAQVLTAASGQTTGLQWAYPPLTIGFVIGSVTIGTNIGPMLIAPRAGTFSKCKVVTKTSDASVDLTFTIKQNGTSVFTSSQTVAHGTAAGTITTITSLTSVPLSAAADDIFQIDVSSGNASWNFVAILES